MLRRFGIPRAEADDPRVTEEHERTEGEIIMQARMLAETKKNYQNLADSQWVVAQRGDRAIRLVMDWLRRRKDDNWTLDQFMKHQVPDAERCIYATHQKDFVLQHNLLYLKVTPKRNNEDILVFVVPGLKWQVVIDGCHRYLGHQGRDRTLSLLRERFWWPGMAQRMMLSIRNCVKCHIFEAKPQIPPMEPILCTKPLDLVHIDSRTTDEYVMSLYDKLKLALASARDTAILEAQRQKQHYDRKAGAVELHLGDKVLVKLDSFRGQRQKLKNQWGDALYTVVKHVSDGIPAYEVKNDTNKKRQVLHWA